MPPQVRDLQSLIATQEAALKPQYDIIDQSVAANEQAGGAQTAGLEATKNLTFKQIGQSSQNKGMFFSGFTPNEEALYTSNTYLPALAQLQSTIANTRNSLLGKKAELGKSAFDVATQQHESDIKVLADWNRMTAEQQFQASQADKQRVFEAQQNQLNRNAAASRASAAAAAASKGAPAGLIASVSTMLNSKKGKDSFVSPETYRAGMQQWVSAGGSPDSYNATFGSYINPTHQAKFGGYL